MRILKFTYYCRYLLLMFLFGWVACTQENNDVLSESMDTDIPISWRVQSEQGHEARALVDNAMLQTSCKESDGGSQESIGVWGEYTMNVGGQNETNEIFSATPLTYSLQEESYAWAYPGDPRYWRNQAVYNFRACYPQTLMESLMTQMDATVFQGGPINTMALQKDILVSAIQVDTRTNNWSKVVPLDMQHVFAALRFKVKAESGFTPSFDEGVTSCWLQNKTNASDLFSPSGYLLYSGNQDSDIVWYTYESSDAPMYLWKHKNLSFNEENILYTNNGGLDGEQYTHNDGWLLIVPQTVRPETLQFCYTLSNAGNQVFSVNIPAVTYEHGQMYTYLLQIRGSEVEVELSITPWNLLKSSYDITL